MTELEDLVRSTTRAIASTVREAPTLRLGPAGDEPTAFAPGSRRRRRWRGWLAPVAAAAAVAAVALSVAAVKDVSNGPSVAAGSTASVPPPYYVTLSPQTGQGTFPPSDLVVGDTRTGRRLATLTPPAGSSFFGVTGAADDRTFVIDTLPVRSLRDPGGPRTWYLLRLAPGTSAPVRLTRLAVPRLANVTAIALSGSGAELAVATGGGAGFGLAGAENGGLPGVLRLYSVSTGKLAHAWSTSDQSVFGAGAGLMSENNTELTWVDDDHAITFVSLWVSSKAGAQPPAVLNHESIRVLDVTAGGGNLLADSRVEWSQTEPAGSASAGCQWGQWVLVAADGKAVVCPSITSPTGPYRKGQHWTVRWLTYSTTAPTVARVLDTVTIAESFPSGLILQAQAISGPGIAIIAASGLFENNHPAADIRVGLIRRGTFVRLPVKLAVSPDFAFTDFAW
jgi:hypothetical protein